MKGNKGNSGFSNKAPTHAAEPVQKADVSNPVVKDVPDVKQPPPVQVAPVAEAVAAKPAAVSSPVAGFKKLVDAYCEDWGDGKAIAHGSDMVGKPFVAASANLANSLVSRLASADIEEGRASFNYLMDKMSDKKNVALNGTHLFRAYSENIWSRPGPRIEAETLLNLASDCANPDTRAQVIRLQDWDALRELMTPTVADSIITTLEATFGMD